MTSSVLTVENICNEALGKIGFARRIGDIYEGSRQSKLCLEFYAQTRDELLRSNDWGFSERDAVAVLVSQAPAGGYSPENPWTPNFPCLPWFYEYAYPIDCIKVRSIRASQIFLPNFSPTPNVFDIVNNAAEVPSQKTIVCNVPNAVLVYSAQITDMSQWEPLFIKTMIDTLAKKLAPGLAEISQGGAEAEKEETQDTVMSETEAARMQG
jgi:hypothetical protein